MMQASFDTLRIVKGWPRLTIQGEGRHTGVPSVFVRLAGCNFRCTRDTRFSRFFTCDTPESLHDYDHKKLAWNEASKLAEDIRVDDLVCAVGRIVQGSRHLVITGGEPLLQAPSLLRFLAAINDRINGLYVTLETNGSLWDRDLQAQVQLVSLSPKLQYLQTADAAYNSSINSWLERGSPASCQVKVVCSSADEAAQALDLFDHIQEHFPQFDGCHESFMIQVADVTGVDALGLIRDMLHVVCSYSRGVVRVLPQMHKIYGVA